MTENFTGGLERPGKTRGLGPWIVLTPSASHLDLQMSRGLIPGKFATHPMYGLLVLSPTAKSLEFSLAYGLGRIFGPWTLRREDIARVQRVRVW